MPPLLIDSAHSSPSTRSDHSSTRIINARRLIMPPERNRTSNPQGRQKSCAECAKSKRRCDLGQPSCLRCTRQQLTCTYPPQPTVNGTPMPQADSTLLEAVVDPEVQMFDLGNDQSVGLLDFDLTTGATSVDALNDLMNDNVEEIYPVTRTNYISGKSFSVPNISPYARSRIEYSVEQFKLAPSTMVTKNRTPWSHPRLYDEDMPRSLQTAHAACALFTAKNETNAEFVARHVTDRAKELVDSNVPNDSLELLAHIQALMLYTIMLTFGGDLRYYKHSENTLNQLENLGFGFHSFTNYQSDPEGSLPLYPAAVARTQWKAFIIRESIRRTLLAAFKLIACCSLLQGRPSACSSQLAVGNRVTLSAHLWNAASAIEFAIAWNEKKHYLVHELDFTEVLEYARPEDVDEFGKMMMAGLMGLDDLKGWFKIRGGAF